MYIFKGVVIGIVRVFFRTVMNQYKVGLSLSFPISTGKSDVTAKDCHTPPVGL